MRVLILSTFDLQGGASRAAYRIHRGLLGIGLDSRLLVQEKTTDDYTILGPESRLAELNTLLRRYLTALPLHAYPGRLRSDVWSPAWWPTAIHRRIVREAPDVINVQWVCDGFLPIQALGRMRRPLVMTLQDAWAVTGGCHYPYDCRRYHDHCGACPQLGSRRERDLSRWGWQQKSRNWRPLPLTVVAISNWLGDCARASSLFRQTRVEVIPNGLDTKRYHPMDKVMARQILGLPQDKHLVLFGAINALRDARKGADFLFNALKELSQTGKTDAIELVVFGGSQPPAPPDLMFPAHYLGFLHDDVSLALLYSAADVMVVPSIQEGLGQTATEACACGTPVVAFDTSGLRDVVEHRKNGYLARVLDAADLARGIAWVLGDFGRHQALRQAARQKAVQEFDLTTVAKRYHMVFQDVVKEWRTSE